MQDEPDNTLAEQYLDLIERWTEMLVTEVESASPKRLQEKEQLQMGFRDRLESRYEEPFYHFQRFVLECFRSGAISVIQHRASRPTGEDLTCEVLQRIHVRSLAICEEVIWLLRGGFPDGAFARWRTIHELMVVALFIRGEGEIAARRYLEHEAIYAHREFLRYRDNGTLEWTSYHESELRTLTDRKSELEEEYGREFAGDYGWAAYKLHKNATLAGIEAHVDMQGWRYYYGLASNGVHPSIRGYTASLTGRDLGGPIGMPAGPSNGGFEDPANSTLFAIGVITSALILHVDSTAAARVNALLELRGLAFQAFRDAAARLSEDTRREGYVDSYLFDDE